MALAPGTRLGPYEVLDLLGAGGMGEVHRARDPRLEREVAIKVLPAGVACEPDRLARFAREAKAAAALNHPNILTVYDVGSATPIAPGGAGNEPIPYVVAELLRGRTLRELVVGGQIAQAQALGYAVQIAHGLAAAHAQGLVHRDLKPENLFVTADERIKILDFGLARATVASAPDQSTESAGLLTAPGTVIGTTAYMSPEQARGLAVDQRTDIFSFGVVLYELLSGQHPFRRPTPTATLAAILEADPPDLAALSGSASPALSGIVRRCLEKAPESRFGSAHDLALALDAVRGTPGASTGPTLGERSPYPGLASFTERDAGVFFGRESEVQALWTKLRDRPLLAVIAPSGAGKTSFVRAGLVPGRPPHWSAVVCTPGSSPLRALGRALVPELGREPAALAALVDVDDPAVAFDVVRRWRAAHGDALLVVDQFEELFTLNAPETQRRFAELLARLASDGDVHVLLSLRDDFLIRCSEHASLAPVFKDLTPLSPLGCDGLTRALVEPARRAGFRFEDEALVDEMIRAVDGARAALPLLAFAVAQLWDGRDRERKLLTRAAYEQMGGVAGALARHAEATLGRIGPERQAMVRELFRSLVTAHGTRAVAEREELLSSFTDRAGADEVLRELVDARLLTSYEVDGHDATPRQHRVEIVHESLLTNWPRLVRWQAQDEEGALLRAQLRQAAHLWDEKGRAADLLWSGTAYQEFELWRGRYQGALTALEADFARAMRDRVRRRRRLVRAGVAGTIAVLAAVAIVVSVSRHQTAVARDEARAEARRAESSRLLALGKLRLDEDPTEALAFATASLELADSRDARVFALRALAEGPPALDLPAIDNSRSLAFSPDGHRVAVAGFSPTALVWKDDGSEPLRLEDHVPSGAGSLVPWWASNTTLAVGLMFGLSDRVVVWSATDGRRLRSLELGGRANWMIRPPLLLATVQEPRGPSTSLTLKSWSLPDGAPTLLGAIDRDAIGMTSLAFDPAGRAVVYSGKRGIRWRPLPADASEPDRALGSQATGPVGAWGHSLLFARNAKDDVLVWTPKSAWPDGPRVIPHPEGAPRDLLPELSGRWLVPAPWSNDPSKLAVWDSAALPGARPLRLRRSGSWYLSAFDVHPSGSWLAASTAGLSRLTFWPLPERLPLVIEGYKHFRHPLLFSPDSRSLAAAGSGDAAPGRMLRLLPVPGTEGRAPRSVAVPDGASADHMAFDPKGRYVLGLGGRYVAVLPLDGAPARLFAGFLAPGEMTSFPALSPSGRFLALAHGGGPGQPTLRICDVETGTVRSFPLPVVPGKLAADWAPTVTTTHFADDATLYTAGASGIRRWNLATGEQSEVVPSDAGAVSMFSISAGGRVGLISAWYPGTSRPSTYRRWDTKTGRLEPLPALVRPELQSFALDPSGSLAVWSAADGVLHVHRIADGAERLLVGHAGSVPTVIVSPNGKWIASAGEDNTIRLWPMPDFARPAIETMPQAQLVAKLKTLTNIRVVRAPDKPDGWTFELDRFPGWRTVPSW